MSFNGGYQSDGVTATGSTINGAVFITDITPQNDSGNVGGKTYSSSGRVLETCQTSTQNVTVHIWATTGHSNMEPLVIVEQQLVNLTQNEDQSVWTGTIDINVQDKTSIIAIHEDGAMHTCTILQDQAPQVVNAVFVGNYPEGQTELKAGDLFQLNITSDTPMAGIEISNFGALQPQVLTIQSTNETTIPVTIANRGNAAQILGAKLRVKNSNGAYGDYFETISQGIEDGIHVLTINNKHPQITMESTTYPTGQQALKNNESVVIQHTLDDFDTVQYASPTGELSISNPNTFEAQKQLSRIAGDFNISNDNFTIQALRSANGAITNHSVQIQVAHVAPTLQLITPETRFRSGGNNGTEAQSYTLEISSTQPLLSSPEITVSEGTLTGEMTRNMDSENPSNSIYQQTLSVHDTDSKGIHTVSLLSATNLAGIAISELSENNQFQIGGFVPRTLTLPAFERIVAIGTEVTSPNKLLTIDKDNAAMVYSPTFSNQLLGYTITNSDGQLSETGDHFYWNDNQAVTNNTTGLATITIEEQA